MVDELKQLDLQKLPRHVAFIIDGNGRWAKQRGLPRSMGHKAGVEAVKQTIQNALEIGIKQLSFFCFSTENWNRPKDEIDQLFSMLRDFIKKNTDYVKKGIKLIVSGDISVLPEDLITAITERVEKTKQNIKMIVNLCINYGGRADILRAVNNLLSQNKQKVTMEEFSKELYTAEMSDPDLIIRTSGELRLSNFFLFQSAYSEFYFGSQNWPDFDKKSLIEALINFQSRNRRFGAIKE